MALDATDREILRILQKGQLSNAELSERVHLSSSACHRRVQRMVEAGVIDRNVALLDARKAGFRALIFVEISLSGQSDELLAKFESAVARIPNVLECHLVAGASDYLLKVAAEDSDDFAQIHRNYLAHLPGVARVQSSFALKTVFQSTALPV
ncbi:Lrp/AsnC family transcriptional regulator [Paracoccaceae bacterium GXU_MW_L88]